MQRPTCHACRRPRVGCYCEELSPVATRPRVLILMHPLEARHPVGTGRLLHRSLSNSRLEIGESFDEASLVGRLVSDSSVRPLLLYPGPRSLGLESLTPSDRSQLIDGPRESWLVVLDGTWDLAQKMLHRSPVLQGLERVSFSLDQASRFLVRRQPARGCLSSLESTCRALSLLGTPEESLAPMIRIFDRMVERQVAFTPGRAAPQAFTRQILPL